MKIAFIGSNGTGKTSVAQEFSRRRPEFKVVGSAAREASLAGYEINKDATPLSQLLTTVARVNLEIAAGSNYITERSSLDHLAYTLWHLKNDNLWCGDLARREYYILQSMWFARNHARNYDHVFYFPVFWKPKGDKFRSNDEIYQKEIDLIIRELLDRFSIEYAIMENESVFRRTDFIETVIKNAEKETGSSS